MKALVTVLEAVTFHFPDSARDLIDLSFLAVLPSFTIHT